MPNRIEIFLPYFPAAVHPGKDYHVSYYVLDPQKISLVRKKIRLNRLSGKKREKYARELVRSINEKLARGWNPFIHIEAPKSLLRIIDAIKTFSRLKEKELEKDSFRSYNSYLNFLEKYITETLKKPNLAVEHFDKAHAVNLMLFIDDSGKRGSTTYNNYLVFYRLFWGWLVEMGYCTQNWFTVIRKKKSKDKRRVPIPDEIQVKLQDYLLKNNPEYLCMMLPLSN
jgi:integrase/recombinase XerD